MLTDRTIQNAKPKQKLYRLYDERGLFIEIAPSKKKEKSNLARKWWRLKYRFAGKDNNISLGIYPTVSLKEAREKRDDMRKLISNGINPSVRREEIKKEKAIKIKLSFENVTREWLSKYRVKWSESFCHKTLRRFEMYVFPVIGKKPIMDINENDLVSTLQTVESRMKKNGKTAHLIATKCEDVFRYAIASNYTKYNPCYKLKDALIPVKEQHFKAQVEPEKIADILRRMNNYTDCTAVVKLALNLVPLIFLRSKELRQIEWNEVKWEEKRIDLPAEKMKMRLPHIVPLSTQAIAILRELQLLTGSSRFVFPHRYNNTKAMSENTVLQAMRRAGIEQNETCQHGFRATARSVLDEHLGFRPDIIELQLAHKVKDPNGRAYNRTTHLEKRYEIMQAWADYLYGLNHTTSEK